MYDSQFSNSKLCGVFIKLDDPLIRFLFVAGCNATPQVPDPAYPHYVLWALSATMVFHGTIIELHSSVFGAKQALLAYLPTPTPLREQRPCQNNMRCCFLNFLISFSLLIQ